MKIQIEVSDDNEGTDSPWWVLIDPLSIHEMMRGVARHGEIPDPDSLINAIASAIEGPFFSRREAETYLKGRSYEYSTLARVWCSSGYWARQYKEALRKASAEKANHDQLRS